MSNSRRPERQAQGAPRGSRDDPLGLTVLHVPESGRWTVDILLVHGLGGSSLRTWCKDGNLELLWPQRWLPREADLSTARILTYGYSPQPSARRQPTIHDLASDLLFNMNRGLEGPQAMGQAPIVVVAHSTGGLLFKAAIIQGNLEVEYRRIVSCIKAVLFLATPHRGIEPAGILNRTISASVFGQSSGGFVRELARNSPTLDELNEAFRHYVARLRIFSFYETMATTVVGPASVMVLRKDSAVLGYPDEVLEPLVASHRDVCRFASENDPNFKAVRATLRYIAQMLRSQAAQAAQTHRGPAAAGGRSRSY